jgi:hypothetical protein
LSAFIIVGETGGDAPGDDDDDDDDASATASPR